MREPYKPTKDQLAYGMALPEGQTCGNCFHFKRCEALFQAIAADEVCDFAPNRFIAVTGATSRGDFLKQKVAEAESSEAVDNPLPERPMTAREQARHDEEHSILIKPQPRSNGRIGGFEI
jgi:hypothetical protein